MATVSEQQSFKFKACELVMFKYDLSFPPILNLFCICFVIVLYLFFICFVFVLDFALEARQGVPSLAVSNN